VVTIGKGNADGAAQMRHFVQEGLNTFRLRERCSSAPKLPPAALVAVQTRETNKPGAATTWQFMINSNNLNGSAGNPQVLAGASATSNGQLDRNNTAQYNQLVQECLATGSYCIIDVHNYARFEGQIIGQGGPTNEQFASLWSQIASMVCVPNILFSPIS
jgi:endoglucanase